MIRVASSQKMRPSRVSSICCLSRLMSVTPNSFLRARMCLLRDDWVMFRRLAACCPPISNSSSSSLTSGRRIGHNAFGCKTERFCRGVSAKSDALQFFLI